MSRLKMDMAGMDVVGKGREKGIRRWKTDHKVVN